MRDKEFHDCHAGDVGFCGLTQKMKLKSINRVFMQVIVATVSSRLLILRCVAFSFTHDKINPLDMRFITHCYQVSLGNKWSSHDRFTRRLRIYLRVACVAPAPLSTGACALPRENAMAMVGTPLIRTILYVTGANVPRIS